MWELYVVFKDRAGRADYHGLAGGINIVADSLAALIILLNPYNCSTHKTVSIQRLRYNGRIQDIRLLRPNLLKR
jgi:hypothetical protein